MKPCVNIIYLETHYIMWMATLRKKVLTESKDRSRLFMCILQFAHKMLPTFSTYLTLIGVELIHLKIKFAVRKSVLIWSSFQVISHGLSALIGSKNSFKSWWVALESHLNLSKLGVYVIPLALQTSITSQVNIFIYWIVLCSTRQRNKCF